MIPSFNVLDRHQNLYRHYVLEASAGTGKTFAIENIVVRFLIDSHLPIPIDRILVVTFTRAATADLKHRIRNNIEKALMSCKKVLNEELVENLPDYLLHLFEQNQEVILAAKGRLENALLFFDKAQIFTIHSFCWRMLSNYVFESNVSLATSSSEEKSVPTTKMLRVIRDFLRTELKPELYSPEQLKIVLGKHHNDHEVLQRELFKCISKSEEIASTPSFSELLAQFRSKMRYLKDNGHFSSTKIVEDFYVQAPAFTGLCDRNRNLKENVLQKIKRFAELFDQVEWGPKDLDLLIQDGLFIVEAFDPKMARKGQKALEGPLHYPNFVAILSNELGSLIKEARCYSAIFRRMAHGCQKHVKRFLNEEEILRHDDLLITMLEGLKNPFFAKKVREGFDAAVIDEFQDTDIHQWDIFRTLFFDEKHPWKGYFYLVGDPKQSIYAFRQADIYTYISAVKAIGSDSQATLDTNYRSQPALLNALNLLFTKTPHLIPLPRLSQALPYREVKAGISEDKYFLDEGKSIQFFMATSAEKKSRGFPLKDLEEKAFFPFIAQEIMTLHQNEKMAFNRFAILVSDRYQALRLTSYLKQCHLPASFQRSASLADSLAFSAMRELLKGVLFFRNESSLKVALGGKIIGWTLKEVLSLIEVSEYENILEKFHFLRTQLIQEGFIKFYESLMQSCWHKDNLSIKERLLLQTDGIDFYLDLQQIADLLAEQQQSRNGIAEELFAYLDEFKELAIDEDERMKSLNGVGKESIQILTLHSSKGLEFDIVFALGLISRNKPPELLVSEEDKEVLYKKHCEEIDAEKSRQLYVAMTRAKYRLYLPIAVLGETSVEKGTASPMELFLARLGQGETDWEGLYQRINEYNGNILKNFINEIEKRCSVTLISLSEKEQKPILIPSTNTYALTPPKDVKVSSSSQYMYSFTSLSKENSVHSAELFTKNAPSDFLNPIKSVHSLPSGNLTGTILHAILETISFSKVREMEDYQDLSYFVRPFVINSDFVMWEETICLIIYQALKTPLLLGNETFSLQEIEEHCMYREMTFMYPLQRDLLFLEDGVVPPGYLKGVIDLIFEFRGKYYIIDWKSNWLGPDSNSYQKDLLETAMQENHYFLQAELYRKALEKYLAVVDSRPFEEIFGGVYYLFLRGLESGNGIYMIEDNYSENSVLKST